MGNLVETFGSIMLATGMIVGAAMFALGFRMGRWERERDALRTSHGRRLPAKAARPAAWLDEGVEESLDWVERAGPGPGGVIIDEQPTAELLRSRP